jgi:hypothetical protein
MVGGGELMYTLEQTKALLDAQVAKKGADFIYQAPDESTRPNVAGGVCLYYNDDNTPGCIVGHVLADIGYGPNAVNEGAGASSLPVIKLAFDGDSQTLLDCVQESQDAGSSWGEAVEGVYAAMKVDS